MLDGGGSGGSFPSGPTGCARPTPAGRDCIDTAVDLFNLVAAIASESDRSRGAAKCLAAACCIAGAGGGVLYALDRTGTSLVPLASQPDGLSNPVEEALALYPKGQPDMADPEFSGPVHEFYNQAPYWEQDFTDSGDWNPADKPHPGRIVVVEPNGVARILEELDHTFDV